MRPLSLALEPTQPSVGLSNGAGSTGATIGAGGAPESQALDIVQSESRICAPRLMPVNLPDPLGPNLFILGEPILHRYYTVYDWTEKKIGFGISASDANVKAMKAG